MLRDLGPGEIILILVVIVLLFGAKRLPDAARSVGRSMRIFKAEVKEMHDDEPETAQRRPTTPPVTPEPRPLEGRIEPPVGQSSVHKPHHDNS
jgi:sec-independent protein translocase protein TatA